MDRFEHLKSALENVKNEEAFMLEKIKKNVQASSYLTFLQNYLLLNALSETFLKNNYANAKQYFYTYGLVDEYLINKFDERTLDYGIDHLSYVLLSDNIHLIQRYADLSHSSYKPMVEKGHSTPLYVLQRIMADDWDNVKRGIAIMDEKTLKKNKPLKPDRDFYESLLNKDADSAKAAIYQLLKDHKKRNKYKPLINEFISTPALGYTKLAWLKGMELDIDHPLVPKELLPFKPLDKYEVAYDFLKE
ncbi:MAG: immunity 49 family protein [Bacteroidota bacterium]